MRSSSDPEERAQFTVAELLARYGESTSTAGRRHRRAVEGSYPVPDIAVEPTAQPTVERNWLDSREPAMPPSEPLPILDSPRRYGSPPVTGGQVWTPNDLTPGNLASGNLTQDNLPQRDVTQRDITQRDITQRDSGPRDSRRPDSTQSGTYPRYLSQRDVMPRDVAVREVTQRDLFQPLRNGRGDGEWAPAVGPPSSLAGEAPSTFPAVARQAPPARTALPDGPVTDQLPRLDPVPGNPAPRSSRQPVSAYRADASQTRAYQGGAYLGDGDPDSAQPPAGLGTATSAIPGQDEHAADELQPSGSPLWEWAVMVSQIGIGVIGGAALWLVCEWLWQRLPVVALVVALAVISGLVWVVRRVRRAEDLQTTVIAVLVGLFVTVSPAALLLVGR